MDKEKEIEQLIKQIENEPIDDESLKDISGGRLSKEERLRLISYRRIRDGLARFGGDDPITQRQLAKITEEIEALETK